MFLTMMFGLMMVFTGSISAQSPPRLKDERPGTLAPNCVGKIPKVGSVVHFTILDSKKGEAVIFHRDGPHVSWAKVCTLSIDVDSAFIKRLGNTKMYTATINHVSPFEVLRKGYLVKWQATNDSDFYIFTTADGKKEVGSVIAMLPRPNPERVSNK